MKADYDIIVMGTGPNSLVAASKCSAAGLSVAVISEKDEIGEQYQTRELIKDFHFNVGPLDAGVIEETIIKELKLKDHGLSEIQAPAEAFAPQKEGPGITLWQDLKKSQESIAQFSEKDAKQFGQWSDQMREFANQFSKMAKLASPSLRYAPSGLLFQWARMAIGLRRLGGKEMMEFIRLLPMGAKRLLDEHFENEELKGLLVVPAIKDLLQGPRAAGTAFNLMYQKMGSSNGSFRKAQTFKGGNGALLEALRKKCESQGIDFLMGKKGYKVRIKDYAATGVRLNNGEEISSKLVLSGLEARKTFLDFVGPTNLEPRFVQRLLNYKLRGSTASIHLALNGLPDFTSATNNDQLSGSIIICPSTDYAEKAFDAAKYGESSSHPVLEARIPSLLDAGLAPDGKHTMSIHYRYAPYDLRGESWDSKKKRISKTTLKLLEDYAPGFSDLVLDSVVIPPKDYEDEYDLTEGSMSQGQMGLDQLLLMRPVPGFSGYLSPVDALYLGSSSSHPGGRGSAMPGWNAADQIIREI